MRILFIVTGVGLGDSVRVETVIEAFKKDNSKTKILVAGYANSYHYFKDKYSTINIAGYRISGKSMKFKVLPFLLRNWILPFFWFVHAFKIKRAVKRFKPDIVISDFEPTGVVLAKLVKRKCVMLFGFDPLLYDKLKGEQRLSPIMKLQAKYLKKIYDQGDHVIVPTLLGVKRRSLIYNYVNPISRNHPKEFSSKVKLMKKLELKKIPILVMLGGSDFGVKLLHKLYRIARLFPEEKFIVFGTKKLTAPSPNVTHYTFKKNVLEYMKVAKGVITLGGEVTLSEAVTFKKPLLIYPIKNHIEQVMNAYRLKRYALIGKDIKHLQQDITQFLKQLPILQSKMDGLKVHTNGAEEIVTIVKTFVDF